MLEELGIEADNDSSELEGAVAGFVHNDGGAAMTRLGCYEIPVRTTDQRGGQVVRLLGRKREAETPRRRRLTRVTCRDATAGVGVRLAGGSILGPSERIPRHNLSICSGARPILRARSRKFASAFARAKSMRAAVVARTLTGS